MRFAFGLLVLGLVAVHCQELNNRPIVGVLLQEQYDGVHQYVAASYVKFLESAGARVVPIFVNKEPAYYTDLMTQINGVLMPGGGTPLLNSSYAKTADLLFELAIAKNNQGIHFPVWASCLSFEKLITYFTGNKDLKWETHCSVENFSMKLDFPANLNRKQVKLFADDVSGEIYEIFATEPVTPNYHQICLAVDTFLGTKNLTEQFTLISTNTYGGIHFVSTIEHKKYPIYSTQWHPEKNQFEWVVTATTGAINHDYHAIRVGQYLGNFLVNESRKNAQKFKDPAKEKEVLIYNYHKYLVYTGAGTNPHFDEVYRFPIKM